MDQPTKDDIAIVGAKLCFAGPVGSIISDSCRSKSHMTFSNEPQVCIRNVHYVNNVTEVYYLDANCLE